MRILPYLLRKEKIMRRHEAFFFLASHFNARSESAFFESSLVPKGGCLKLHSAGPQRMVLVSLWYLSLTLCS